MKRRRSAGIRSLLGATALFALLLPFGLALVVRPFIAASASKVPALRLEQLRREISTAVRAEGGALAIRPDYEPPAGLGLIVEDAEGRVLYSTVGAFVVGSRANVDELVTSLRGGEGLDDFFFESIRSGDSEYGRYFAWFDRDYVTPSPRPSPLFPLVIIGLGAIAFALGVGIATYFARAVMRLEKSAGKIAAGDLESEVRVGGVREIEELSLAMDGMRAALKEDRDRRARFLAAISHDLRTPLTSIGGYLEAVEDGLASDPATLERYVAIMRSKTRLLEARISSLIEFARIETAEWRMGFEALELRAFLESLAREFGEDAALTGRSFASEFSCLGDLRVPADKALLSRAFENLVSNAIRYSPEGGSVSLSASRREGGGYALRLDDDGPGIAPAERERVFEPFVRGASAKRGEGSGLGLYIARSVIQGHGWAILAEESPSGGARIAILIPPLGSDACAPAAPSP